MATRGYIGKVQDNGKIIAVYTHWDSYPSNNGRLILDHYANQASIDEIISLGSLSSLGERLNPVGPHSFDKPEDGTTVFYGRDRNENPENIKPVEFDSEEDYIKNGEEFNYLWKDGKIFVGTYHEPENGKWKSGVMQELTHDLIKEFEADGW